MTRSAAALLLLLPIVATAPPVPAAEVAPAPRPVDPRRAALLKAGYTPVPLIADADRFLIECQIGTERAKFLLDTGAGVMGIDLALAKKLKLKLGEQTASVGLGGAARGWEVTFTDFVMGGYDFRGVGTDFNAVAKDLSRVGADGIIGMATLDPFAAVIDYPAKTLYIRPPLLTAWLRLAGTWAVTGWQEDGQAREIDPKAPPTLAFVDQRLRVTDGGAVREYALGLIPSNEFDRVYFFDPNRPGRTGADVVGFGIVRAQNGTLTACLAFDRGKAKDQPEEFAAPKGSGFALLQLTNTDPGAAKKGPPADPLRQQLLASGYSAVPMEHSGYGERMVSARVGKHDVGLVVDTGANYSTFEPASLRHWGGVRVAERKGVAIGGPIQAEMFMLRGLQLGGYDTRSSFSVVVATGVDLSAANRDRVAHRQPPMNGFLGHAELRNGSAVIDFHTDTLYLRPVKADVWPKLEGKWVATDWEKDGQRGRYPAGGGTALEFKDGRYKFTAPGYKAEWAVHVQDEGVRYRIGLFDPKKDDRAEVFAYDATGIFKVDGDRLTLVLVDLKATVPLGEFAAPKGSGRLLIEFERAK